MSNNAIFYITPDNGLYPYVSTNFTGDHDTNQMDRMYYIM